MRYVPLFCLREGMKIGKSLYGNNGELLLAKDTILAPSYIESLKKIGYNGIYVIDDISADIEVKGIISDELRQKSVKGIKDTFIAASKDKDVSGKMEDMKRKVEDIISEIISNKNLMVNIIDLRFFDDYTYYHSVNVAVLSVVMGVALGFNKQNLYKLGLGALLHDIGKVFIDKEILNKPGKLTIEEFAAMKCHPENGYQYMKKGLDIPTTSYIGALEHHEKYDGSGYPYGKSKDSIFHFGRIIAIADVYDALTSERPYRKAMLPSEAIEYIMGGCGTLFDPEMVKVFVRKVAPYPIGTCVRLSDKRTGIVMENYEECCLRPKIRIFMEDNKPVAPYILTLKDNYRLNNVTITAIEEI